MAVFNNMNKGIMPYRMKIVQKTVTPDADGRFEIDADLPKVSHGFGHCSVLGNVNAVITASTYRADLSKFVGYVKHVETGNSITTQILVTAFIYYII